MALDFVWRLRGDAIWIQIDGAASSFSPLISSNSLLTLCSSLIFAFAQTTGESLHLLLITCQPLGCWLASRKGSQFNWTALIQVVEQEWERMITSYWLDANAALLAPETPTRRELSFHLVISLSPNRSRILICAKALLPRSEERVQTREAAQEEKRR